MAPSRYHEAAPLVIAVNVGGGGSNPPGNRSLAKNNSPRNTDFAGDFGSEAVFSRQRKKCCCGPHERLALPARPGFCSPYPSSSVVVAVPKGHGQDGCLAISIEEALSAFSLGRPQTEVPDEGKGVSPAYSVIPRSPWWGRPHDVVPVVSIVRFFRLSRGLAGSGCHPADGRIRLATVPRLGRGASEGPGRKWHT